MIENVSKKHFEDTNGLYFQYLLIHYLRYSPNPCHIYILYTNLTSTYLAYLDVIVGCPKGSDLLLYMAIWAFDDHRLHIHDSGDWI